MSKNILQKQKKITAGEDPFYKRKNNGWTFNNNNIYYSA